MMEKLEAVRRKQYIAPGTVTSLTSFFSVPKGKDDVRMVYDATASGLNESIWVPHFPLPTIESHLRCVDENSHMADNDIGEMFLNFMLHPSLRELCGVDLTAFSKDDNASESSATPTPATSTQPSPSTATEPASRPKAKRKWERWQRAAMGMKSSPYQAVQSILFADEVIKGDRHDPDNVFNWSDVELNLPGMDNYNPSRPWVSQRDAGGNIAANSVTFVDDVRPSGSTD